MEVEKTYPTLGLPRKPCSEEYQWCKNNQGLRKVRVTRAFCDPSKDTAEENNPTAVEEDIEDYQIRELYYLPRYNYMEKEKGKDRKVPSMRKELKFVHFRIEQPVLNVRPFSSANSSISADGTIYDQTQIVRKFQRSKQVFDPSASPYIADDGPSLTERGKKRAFLEIPGKPGVYGFNGHEGVGSSTVIDLWSKPELSQLRDRHVLSWENNTFHESLLRGVNSEADGELHIEKLIIGKRHVSMIEDARERARFQIDCLTAQLREFCEKEALRVQHITPKRVLLMQGDAQAKVVFLIKTPPAKIFRKQCDARTKLPITYLLRNREENGLGIHQTNLRIALLDVIQSTYEEMYGCLPKDYAKRERILVGILNSILPMLGKEYGDVNENPRVGDCGGIAILYAMPLADPNNWTSSDPVVGDGNDGELEDYYSRVNSSANFRDNLKKKKKISTSSYSHGKPEFPANVMGITSFYVQKTLDIISPVVVVGLSWFLSKYLSSHLDANLFQLGNGEPINKFFKCRLLSSYTSGNSGIGIRGKGGTEENTCKVVDPITGVVVERRNQVLCIRADHPYTIKLNQSKEGGAKTSMKIVAEYLFKELGMRDIIAGKQRKEMVWTKYLSSACETGGDESSDVEDLLNLHHAGKEEKRGVMKWIRGNIVCVSPTVRQLDEWFTNEGITSLFLLYGDVPKEGIPMTAFLRRFSEWVDSVSTEVLRPNVTDIYKTSFDIGLRRIIDLTLTKILHSAIAKAKEDPAERRKVSEVQKGVISFRKVVKDNALVRGVPESIDELANLLEWKHYRAFQEAKKTHKRTKSHKRTKNHKRKKNQKKKRKKCSTSGKKKGKSLMFIFSSESEEEILEKEEFVEKENEEEKEEDICYPLLSIENIAETGKSEEFTKETIFRKRIVIDLREEQYQNEDVMSMAIEFSSYIDAIERKIYDSLCGPFNMTREITDTTKRRKRKVQVKIQNGDIIKYVLSSFKSSEWCTEGGEEELEWMDRVSNLFSYIEKSIERIFPPLCK